MELAADLASTWKKAGITLLGKGNKLEVKIHVVESNCRLLPNLPTRISRAVTSDLKKMGVHVHTSSTVSKVDKTSVYTAQGKVICAAIKVWATGIRAPDVCAKLDGLKVNKINQIINRKNSVTR